MRPRVLMVTGVYDPETSGASLQSRQLIATLRPHADFQILTTSADAALPRQSVVDGINVSRVHVDPSRPKTKVAALAPMTAMFARAAWRADIVHFHGFSQKNVWLALLARVLRRRTVMKLTSVGHDDALTMRRQGGIAFRVYRSVDRAIAVSPRLEAAWSEAGLDADRVTLIPNAVDTSRFRPAVPGEREKLRQQLGWPLDCVVVLFVGFFSAEKQPELLYRVWARLYEEGVRSTLVLVGATRSAYFEVDASIAERVRADAAQRALSSHVHFVERTTEIENYYRAADVFALPTTREGLPNVLLESMASGVPPVITRLDGVTDWIVEDGRTGRLAAAADEEGFARALREMITSHETRARIGAAARAHVERHFTPEATASRTLDLYRQLCASR
jgi:glycosyltransferase involved in cell wall biosynthesis